MKWKLPTEKDYIQLYLKVKKGPAKGLYSKNPQVHDTKEQGKINNRIRTLKFLKKHNIPFEKGNLQQTVILFPKSNPITLVLAKVNTKHGWHGYKCKFKGSKKWYIYSKNKFLELIEKNI